MISDQFYVEIRFFRTYDWITSYKLLYILSDKREREVPLIWQRQPSCLERRLTFSGRRWGKI